MKKTISIFTLALLLVFAGCDYFGVAVAPVIDPNQDYSDPEIGGGQEPPGGGVIDPNADQVGGGQEPLQSGPTVAAPVRAPGGVQIVLPALSPGESLKQGAVTLTLEQIRAESGQLVVHYTLSGLDADYVAASSAPLVQLADGTLLAPTGGAGGGGTSNGETNRYTFPALPFDARQFTLLLQNQWSGSPETWQVPVLLQQLQ